MASPINFRSTNWKRCVRSVRMPRREASEMGVSGVRPKQGSRTDHGRITDSFLPMIRTDRTDDFQSGWVRVYDDAGNVTDTHEHAGEFKEC